MKVALAFFGLPRCSEVTFPSIERHLIAPLSAFGDLRICHHLYRQPRVFNPRSGEDAVLDPANYEPFAPFEGVFDDDPQPPAELLPRLARYGDAWQDGFHSLRNCLLQLQSLLVVSELVARDEPDVVVFARPDLLYHDPLPVRELEHAARQPELVTLPDWESWGGLNDRFAIAGRRSFRAYGGRLLLADHYCERTGQPLHAESLLRHALAFARVPVRTMDMQASRVRIDGRVHAEDFDGAFSPLVRLG